MQSVENVIVDTSVWVEYLRGQNVAQREVLATLIRNGSAYLCGVVLAELLAGARSARDHDLIDTLFRGVPYWEFTRVTWARAGALASSLRAGGTTLPFADLLVAAVALEHGCSVFTHDTHFQRIPAIPLYQPP